MKIEAWPSGNEVEIRLVPENNWDAFVVKQLDCSTPTFRVNADYGYLSGTLRNQE